MFSKAIKEISSFTRPILFVERLNSDKLIPGSATLFFVNEDGVALTCKHVVTNIINVANHSNKAIFKIDSCYQKIDNVEMIVHPIYDLAIIKFNGVNPLYNGYATFRKDDNVKPGEFLVRSGFAFHEFDNYKIDIATDKLVFTQSGHASTPLFSSEGMVSRLVADKNGNVAGIELSTPGIRGTSGGPLYDKDGLVCGVQSLTKHYHLGFDIVNENVLVNGSFQEVSNYPFISLGECVHLKIIKDFLKENNIKYYEK